MTAHSDADLGAHLGASFAGFSRDHLLLPVQPSSRAIASLLTATLFALLALVMLQPFWRVSSGSTSSEIVATIDPDAPVHRTVMTPPFRAHLLKPRAEVAAAPSFTIAADAPATQGVIAPSAAQSSPVSGGAPTPGTGTGQISSANGAGGNGTGNADCHDAAWARSVSERIARFYRYPEHEAHEHITGVTYVHLIVRRSGLLDLVEVRRSSGDIPLDNAAYDAVLKAQPLPFIPERMHSSRIDAEIPITFGLGVNFKAAEYRCGQ